MFSGFSLVAWVNSTDIKGGSIVSKHVNYYYNGFTMSETGNANLTTDNSLYYITTTETYNDGNWNLFVGIYYGTMLSIYVNGVYKLSKFSNYTIGNDINIRIGADSYFSFFTGKIDDVRIWKRVLSEDDIFHLYNE